jgi:hypothetical protein
MTKIIDIRSFFKEKQKIQLTKDNKKNYNFDKYNLKNCILSSKLHKLSHNAITIIPNKQFAIPRYGDLLSHFIVRGTNIRNIRFHSRSGRIIHKQNFINATLVKYKPFDFGFPLISLGLFCTDYIYLTIDCDKIDFVYMKCLYLSKKDRIYMAITPHFYKDAIIFDNHTLYHDFRIICCNFNYGYFYDI